MKNIGYQFIIVILSLINIFLNFETLEKKDYYNVRVSEGYRNIGLPTNPIKSGYTTNKLPIQSQPVQNSMNVPPVLKEEAYLSAAFDYSLGDARLVGEAGVMKTDIALTINPIEGNELPPLNQGMVNVTGDNSGYRMLPKGMVFRNDINIILPYDSTLLPMGFTPNDIKTYYYHDTYKRWIEIERDSIDENNQLVISKVNHFTDFINAVLKTPEMPETSAYAPTQMNDIKAANPFEGLQIMQPPTANNSGSTNMSYPIEIPAGRQGMQPSLALNYNGTTASGFVGVGWDLSIPAITVETRWGVPRYYQDKESELYLLNGQQLVTKNANGELEDMPHRTNQWKLRANNPTETQFFPRINETFDSIVRHGTNPTNYWWSVTDRNGITSYYGKKHGLDQVDPNAVLTDANNNIAHWSITETRDINGNTVRYYYSIESNTGLVNYPNASSGKNIYIDSINYTGYVDAQNQYVQGKYQIEFYYSDNRVDRSVTCNYGFKVVDFRLLCHIIVGYDNTTLKSYQMRYSAPVERTNYKHLLLDLVRFDDWPQGDCHIDGDLDIQDPNTLLLDSDYVRTHFDYYEKPLNVFGEYDTIIGVEDYVMSFFVTEPSTLLGAGKATGLGATRGKSWSVGGTGTVGLGPIVILSSTSVGGNFDYSRSKNEGALTLIDLDGDGLADKVYKKSNGKVFFRKQIVDANGKNSFNTPEYELIGIKDFQSDVSSNTGWGLQASAGINYSGSWPTNRSTTNTYFTDVNADGLPDLITDEGVLFNSIVNGIPTFINHIKNNYENQSNSNPDEIFTSALDPCGSIIFDGFVNDEIACDVQLIFDTLIVNRLASYSYQDFLNDYGDSTIYLYFYTLIDEYNFRAEVYRKVINCEPVALDPDIDAVRTWIAPRSGIIRIISKFQLLEDTTESSVQSRYKNGVRYAIELCDNIGDYSNYMPNNNYNLDPPFDNILLKSLNVAEDDTIIKNDTIEIPVSGNSIFFFRLQSKKNRDFDKVSWVQDIQYIDYLSIDPMDDHYNSQRDFLVTGIHSIQAPADGTIDGIINISTGNLNNQTFTLIVGPDDNPLNAIINQTLISNSNYSINFNDTVYEHDTINFYILSSVDKNDTIWKEISIIPLVDFRPYPNDTTYLDTISFKPIVNYLPINQINANILDTVFYGLFGPMYRGWGQFGYNNNYPNADTSDVINVSLLKRQLSLISSSNSLNQNAINAIPCTTCFDADDMTASFESNGMYNPLSVSTRWVEMNPNNYHQSWIGYGNITYISKDVMANTRIYELYTDPETEDIPSFDHPVPTENSTSYGPKTIRKVNESYSKNHSVNINVGIPIGGSTSGSDNKVITDYMDLNGDRYPDILGPMNVQYTKPWGGIDTNMTPLNPSLQIITLSQSNSSGFTFSGSYPVAVRMPSSDPKKAKMTISGKGSPGGNVSLNTDQTAVSWMDVNGDGLPDKVSKNGTVALNLGYKFTSFDSLNIPTIRNGSSESLGASYGLNFDVSQGSIGGGLGVSVSQNHTEKILMDFNGDGLPDYAYRENGELKVQYNLGNGTYSSEDIMDTINKISYGVSANESLNASINIGFTLWGFKIGLGLSGAPYNKTFSKDKVQWVDINGDGYVDYVTSEDEDMIRVRYNQTGMTNLLKKVTNFTGSTIELDYHLTENSYDSPQRSWVLKSVKTNDAYSPVGGNSSYVSYEYRNPNYNRFERISYGYDTVITYQYDSENNNTLYRKTIQGYNNKSFIKKGKKTCETICDATGKVYVETFYDVDIFDANGVPLDDDDCPQLYFPNRVCEVTNYYEGMTTPQITTKKCVTYDSKKNVIEYINLVDSASSVVEDNLRAKITYKTGMPNNMISLVDSIKVYNSEDVLLREKTAEYSTNGKLKKIIQYDGSNQAEIEFEYDQYGNVEKMTFPENANQQRMWNQYVYDPVVHSYPITVSNALGYQSSAEYDYKWGKPTKTFDVNGQEMQYEYDIIGRLKKIIGPNEIASSALYTIQMEYHPANYGRWDIFTPTVDTFSYARTFHYMANDPTNPIQTTILCDGLGRVLQTKKDIDSSGVELMVVSGRIWYDSFGRTLKQFHPVTEPLGQDKFYNYSYDLTTQTHTEYDVLDRQTMIALPTGDMSFMEYTFGNDAFGVKRFLTISTDPNGNRVKTYTDPRKLQSTVVADSVIITKFIYSALGELLESIDPEGISTYYSYNNFGQKIRRIHPDAGIDTFYYDLAGNLISRQTQDLLNNSMTIDYVYNYNQLLEIHYPKNPENDVYYYYGGSSAPNNCIGRIYAIEDASGRQEFSYGAMGEVIGNVRTFALPNESNTYTFAMKFEYDSWNRILGTTYPDGEHVRYWYNKGGQLSKMASDYNNVIYPFIDSVVYNKFEQRAKIFYGNGTKAEYGYDILQRLVNLKSTSASGVMQRIDYSFDHVNNIRSIDNSAGVLSNGLGGTYRHDYSYDNIYRLTSSTGAWDNNNNPLGYQLDLTYTMDGRIQTKTQSASTLIGGNLSSFSYDNHYSYNTNQPHTLNLIDDNQNQTQQFFDWDANGNLTFHKTPFPNNITRSLCWDEENRLMAVGDNNYTSYYVYENGGERTYKLTGPNTLMNINGNWMNFAYMDNPTLYTSAYLVAGVQGYTKHYYAGSERVSSAIGLGGLDIIDSPLELTNYHNSWEDKATALNDMMSRTIRDCLGNDYNNKKNLQGLYQMTHASSGTMARYFYHPDHIGSSSWITDGTGQAIQHLHYLPFGEDWVDQRNTSWNAPYTFSGKEKDAETGYGYFGARYYDSGLSIWLSVDPMSDKYPSMSPYNYCANNPVKIVDPNGEYIQIIAALCTSVAYMVGDIVSQTITSGMLNMKNKEGFFDGWSKNVDWADVAISGAVGFVDGITLGASKGITTHISIALKAGIDIENHHFSIVGGQYFGLEDNSKSFLDATVDYGTGYLSWGIGKSLGLNKLGDDIDMGKGWTLLGNASLIESIKGVFMGIFNIGVEKGGDTAKKYLRNQIQKYSKEKYECGGGPATVKSWEF